MTQCWEAGSAGDAEHVGIVSRTKELEKGCSWWVSVGACRWWPELAEMRIEGNIGTYAKGERRCRERIGFPVSIKRREAISSSSAERC